MTAGGAIYQDQCSACHGFDGKGVAYLFPSLAGSANVHSDNPTSLIRVLLQGARSVATDKEPTGPAMPSFGWKLDDHQAAAVLTYIRNSWGGAARAGYGGRSRKAAQGGHDARRPVRRSPGDAGSGRLARASPRRGFAIPPPAA